MTAPILQTIATTSNKINSLPQKDGQLIFVTDIKTIYFDLNSKRLAYNLIQTLGSDAERDALPHPLEGYYYVEDTNVLWRYKTKWCQITESNAPHYIFQESIESFPTLGNSRYLYATNKEIYRWNDVSKSYDCVSNKTEWEKIGK